MDVVDIKTIMYVISYKFMIQNIAMICGKCGFDRTHNFPRVVV
jgi:hypothetical protein